MRQLPFAGACASLVTVILLEESAPLESVLAKMWQNIQSIKELIATIANNPQIEKPHFEELLNQLRYESEQLSSSYGESGAASPIAVREAAHDAKGLVVTTLGRLNLLSHEMKDQPSIIFGGNLINELLDKRAKLTACQQALASERSDLRMKNLQRYLDMLVPQRTHDAASITKLQNGSDIGPRKQR